MVIYQKYGFSGLFFLQVTHWHWKVTYQEKYFKKTALKIHNLVRYFYRWNPFSLTSMENWKYTFFKEEWAVSLLMFFLSLWRQSCIIIDSKASQSVCVCVCVCVRVCACVCVVCVVSSSITVLQSMKLGIDVNRHKEIIVKAISALLLLLLKHFKLNHIYQVTHTHPPTHTHTHTHTHTYNRAQYTPTCVLAAHINIYFSLSVTHAQITLHLPQCPLHRPPPDYPVKRFHFPPLFIVVSSPHLWTYSPPHVPASISVRALFISNRKQSERENVAVKLLLIIIL